MAAAPIVELGLGGSLSAKIIAEPTYKFWRMTRIGNAVEQFASLGIPPAGWSSGDTLTIVGDPLVDQGSDLPEGGMAITLNGSTQYLASVYDETNAPSDIGPQTFECVVTIHALPGIGEEPAVMGGSTDFAITATSGGLIRGWYNGTAVVDLPFTVDEPLHVVLNRNDGSPDVVRLVVNNVVAQVSVTNADLTRGHLHLGRHWSNAHFLNATYSLAAIYPVRLSTAAVSTHYAAIQWTDVTDDCHGLTPLVIETGIRDVHPIARVAGTGICTFALKNGGANSGGAIGYYSPGHANQRAGFGIGIPMRVRTNDGSTVLTQFIGRLRTIAPTPGKTPPRITRCVATDLLDDAARFRLNQLPILLDVRGDAVFRSLVAKLPNQPSGLTAALGSEVYPLALDNTRDEAIPMLEEFVRLALSERGRIYQSRTGALVYENRDTRGTDHPSATLTLDDDVLVGLDVTEITADALNRVEVTVHPREIDDDPTTVLFALANPLEIPAGETRTIVGPYRIDDSPSTVVRVGGLDLQPPIAGTDYLMNAVADGSGADLTASLVVVANYGANGVSYTLTNTSGSTGYVTRLQARGKGVYDFRTVILVAEDAEAIARFGVNAIAWDMPYQESATVGQEAADELLAAYGGLTSRPKSATVLPDADGVPSGVLALDVSDRIAIAEGVTAINSDVYINGRRLTFQSGKLVRAAFWLAPTVEEDL